jgi:hypothetical protein
LQVIEAKNFSWQNILYMCAQAMSLIKKSQSLCALGCARGCLLRRQNLSTTKGAHPAALAQPLCHAIAVEVMLARQSDDCIIGLKLAEAYRTIIAHEVLLGHRGQAIDAISTSSRLWHLLIQPEQ